MKILLKAVLDLVLKTGSPGFMVIRLASFGQQKLIGVYRWLILSFISFVLTHCWAGDPPSRVYLSLQRITLPDWKEAALQTLHQLLPKTAVNLLPIEVESKRELLASGGASVRISFDSILVCMHWCKM